MEQNEIMNRIYSYLFYALGTLCVVCAALLSSAYLAALASLVVLISAVYLNSGHIVNNLLVKRSNIIEIYNGFRLDNNLESAVKRIGDEYRAVSIALLNPGKVDTAMHDAIKALIESVHEPFEFSIMLKEADGKKMIESLDTKRRMKEILLARLDSGKQDRINALKREIDILGTEIQNVRKGGKALDVILKLCAFGSSVNGTGAARESSAGIKRVADAFSSALGMDYEILRGEELLNFIEANQ